MTINELIKELEKAQPSARVYFSFFNCVPTRIDSSRGDYSKPALGWEPSGYSATKPVVYPTVSSLLTELKDAINGKIYSGWKGGDYYYHGDEELYVDNPGDWTNTTISNVTFNEYRAVIHLVCDTH